MIQRRAIDRHQSTVAAGLAVGHDDVSVQVRITRPGGLVLVGDRHQAGESNEVFLPVAGLCTRVYPA